jgi:hypothetical protein
MRADGVVLKTVRSWIRLRARVLLGKLYNLAGVPGLVRNCEYDAGITRAHVSVRVGDLFTVVRVNGLDIYFHRLTGAIDGVGFSPASDCTMASTGELAHLAEQPADRQLQPQMQIPLADAKECRDYRH